MFNILVDSSITWVVNDIENSLGFTLANKGYDVWLGNSRGNYYSNTHEKYNVKDKEFWEFTW